MQTVTSPPSPAPAEAPPAPRIRRLAARAHLVLPGALTALFAFRAGGFFPLFTGVGAVALCLVLLLRITTAERPFAGWSRAAAVAATAATGLASWTLLSALWSHAPERALVEFDRVLLYAAVLVVMATFPRRRGDLTITLRWVLAALVAACAAGLGSRLAPDLVPISSHYLAERLSFPLTYWNAMGLACALATVLALHHGSGHEEPRWVRVAATAALPVTAVTLYFSFSRGGIAACVLGIVAYVLLAPSRRLLFTFAAAAAPVAAGLWTAYHAGLLATAGHFEGGGPAEGHRVALVLAGCVAAAAVLRVLLGRVERRTLRRPRPALSRGRVAGVAVLAVLLLGSAAVIAGLPREVIDQARTFTHGGVLGETGDARDRLLSGSANGRLELWNASLDSFAASPLHGSGAGTFQLAWQQRRPFFLKLQDGHSLYLEVLGELGVVGALLLLAMLATPVAVALRRLRGHERQAHAAFLAAGLTLLVHAGVDWDWEMPVLFTWFFGAAGVLLARPAAAASAGAGLPRLARLVAGLACLLVAITPAAMAISQSRLDRAATAFQSGDCPAAVDAALSALDAMARAEAHEIVGYCDLRGRQNALAIQAMQAAHARDPDNWQYDYGLAIARALSGQDPRPAMAAAVRRNPREPLVRALAKGLASPSAKRRYQAAASATIPSD